MKKFLIVCLFVFPITLCAQFFNKNNIIGFWIQVKNELPESNIYIMKEETIFKYYTEKVVTWIWYYNSTSQIESYKIKYGFYDSCDLLSLDSLKSSGKYYFELDSSNFEDEEDEELRKMNTFEDCAELSIYTHEGDTLMTIYYSSRQQFVTYKKINSLPEIVTKYLKEKGIEVKK